MPGRTRPLLADQLGRVAELLTEGLEDEAQQPPSPTMVAMVVSEAAAAYDGVPIGDFVAVLTERRARAVLRAKGLRRSWVRPGTKRAPPPPHP